MADNIIIKITSEADLSEAQKQLAELTKRAKEQEKAMRDLSDTEKEDAKSIKALGLQEDELAKALQNNKKYYNDLRDEQKAEIAATKLSIKELEKQVKAYRTMQGQSGKVVQQLRAMRERLMELEDAGEFGTQAFVDLSIAAAKLEDQIGDTQQRIRILSSDTKVLDTVMGLGDGLAGAFYIATSAAEVFGDEIEGLQKAFYKVQAAMSIVSGAQQVYNALQKDSVVAVMLSAAVEKLRQKALEKSIAIERLDNIQKAKGVVADGAKTASLGLLTKAQWKLNAAIAASPWGAVITAMAVVATAVAYLVSKIKNVREETEKAAEKQREYNELLNEKQVERINKYKDAIEDLRQANEQLSDALDMRTDVEKWGGSIEDSRARVVKYTAEIEKLDKELQHYQGIINAGWKLDAKQAEEINNKIDKLREERTALEDNIVVERQYQTLLQQRIDKEKADKEKEDEERRKEEAKRRAEERKREVEEAERLLQDVTIELMKEGAQKEIAQIRLNYERQIEAIKGNSESELKLRESLEKRRDEEISKVEEEYANKAIERQNEIAKELREVIVANAKKEADALTGEESIEFRKSVWARYYDERANQIRENAEIEVQTIKRIEKDEELAAARIAAVYSRMYAELGANQGEWQERTIEIDNEYLAELERAVVAAESKLNRAQTGGDKLEALREMYDAQLALYDEQQSSLDAKYQAGLITYQDYKQQEFEIAKEIADAEVEYQQQSMQAVADSFQTALGYMQQISDMAFEALGQNVQAEMDALSEMYTTDAEEAKKNSNKKLITQEEYDKKEAALKLKKAKYDKAQALINASIQTAMSIMQAIGNTPPPYSYVLAAISAAMGAAQIGIIASKPLAQYAKGRKGGKGEYALVGEKGAELMYVPQGASIVPHDKINRPETWQEYNVPKLNIPELPNVSQTVAQFIKPTDGGLKIDYDKLGEAVARNIPKMQRVVVNVDRAGVHVNEGREMHTYLNRKYVGSWH